MTAREPSYRWRIVCDGAGRFNVIPPRHVRPTVVGFTTIRGAHHYIALNESWSLPDGTPGERVIPMSEIAHNPAILAVLDRLNVAPNGWAHHDCP